MVHFLSIRRVGGGFNPTNGSILTPRRVVPPINGHSPGDIPSLQVMKAPGMGPGMPPPPPYAQEQSFHAQTPGMTPGMVLSKTGYSQIHRVMSFLVGRPT